MDWTEKQILETLRFIEESAYDEVRLETENFKLHVRKSGAPAASIDTAPPAAAAPAPMATRVDANAPGTPQAGTEDREDAVAPGMVAIRAPMVGTFYRTPAPHLPPFVELGASVKPEDTVCLIEIMKLFNTIKAGVSGKIVKILAQNAATVKRDQVLIVIEPLR